MDATPRQLTLDDLTRDELLEYARHAVPHPRQRDLWYARCNGARRKTKEAGRRALAAEERRDAASAAYNAAARRMTAEQLTDLREAYVEAQNACAAAYDAQKKAWEAEAAASDAYFACPADL